MHKFSTILTLIFFAGCAGALGVPVEPVAVTGGSPPTKHVETTSVGGAVGGTTQAITTAVVIGQATQAAIQVMADEFRSLRAIQGHFGGGIWNDDVDKWMGRKHQLMIELGDRLGGGAYSRTRVVDLLGAPDATAQEGDALYDLIRDQAEFERPAGGAYEFLIYHWRGEHDFLYFTCRGEEILNSGWWYAGE